MTARDLEGPVRAVRKKLFHFVGVLRVADAIAEQDHAVFEISRLPGVQELIGGCQCEHVARVGRICLLGRMAVRSSPGRDRQKKKTGYEPDPHTQASPHCLPLML